MALLVGLLALTPVMSTATGQDSISPEQLVIEMAHVPANHAALAAHYRAKAADTLAEAVAHEQMGQTYN